jgi:3'-phosphoadenosine 5'-phosphosulfate sulfotransferase
MVNRQQQHNIRARWRLASQWQSSLTIARRRRGLKEYITADPQRELEVRR